MKNLFFSLLAIILIGLFSCNNQRSRTVTVVEDPIRTIGKDSVLFNVSVTNRVIISIDHDYSSKGSSTDTLKSIIEKLYKEKKVIISGKEIVWTGKGFPVWAPYGSIGPNYWCDNLFFGYLEEKDGNVYYVKGKAEKDAYYPYKF